MNAKTAEALFCPAPARRRQDGDLARPYNNPTHLTQDSPSVTQPTWIRLGSREVVVTSYLSNIVYDKEGFSGEKSTVFGC